MAFDSKMLGQRIASIRKKSAVSQEDLADMASISRKHISLIETGDTIPRTDVLTHIANALRVSADDLLVDSLEYSSSTADSKLHRLLLECNKTEEDIIVRNAENLKALLYFHDVK